MRKFENNAFTCHKEMKRDKRLFCLERSVLPWRGGDKDDVKHSG